MTRVGGIVLCGGKSSRMGRPKALLPFGGEVLLHRVVRVLSGVIEPVVVVAGPSQVLPPLPPGVLVARDDREYLGPLNGLAAGLAALGGRAEVAYLTSCDVPFLRPSFVRRVVEGLGEADVCLPDVGGFKHPLAAAYRVSVLAVVRELIAANRLRPVFLTEAVPTCVLGPADFDEADLVSLRNVNTPEEYEAAVRAAGHAPGEPA
jgi:molybdopterin-guanine dinucleotide biosynthesis protein A